MLSKKLSMLHIKSSLYQTVCVCESDEQICHNPHTFDIDELASNIEQDQVFYLGNVVYIYNFIA